MQLATFFIGEPGRDKFCEAETAIVASGGVAVGGVSDAVEVIFSGVEPAVIVVAQAWVGQFSVRDFERLQRAAPLARIVRLLGPWMEGEVRTGCPWPGARRAYWHQSAARLLREIGDREIDGTNYVSSWSMPVTANDADRLLAACGVRQSSRSTGTTMIDDNADRRALFIGIATQQRETAESLADVCTMRGWLSVWLREPPTDTPVLVDALVFDAAHNSSSEANSIAAWKAAGGGAPIVALVGFPRLDDVYGWTRSGVAAIVSKPFLAEDLLWQIEQLVPHVPLAA